MANEPTSKQNGAIAQPLDMDFLESLKNLRGVEPESIRGRMCFRIFAAIADAGDSLPASIDITRQNILDALPPASGIGEDSTPTRRGLLRLPRFVTNLQRPAPQQVAVTLWADLIQWLGKEETMEGLFSDGGTPGTRVRITRVSEDLVRVEFLPPE